MEAIHEFPVPQPGQSASAIRVHRYRVRHKLHEAIEEVLPDRGITIGGPSGRGYEWLTEGLRPGESNHGLSWGNWLKARVRFSLPEEQSQVARGMAERRRERLKRGSRKKASL